MYDGAAEVHEENVEIEDNVYEDQEITQVRPQTKGQLLFPHSRRLGTLAHKAGACA